MQWLNALAMLMMITSGWGVYDDDPILGWLYFPEWARLAGWAASSLLWRFAAMWLLMVNGLFYLAYGLATGRFRRKLLPIPKTLWAMVTGGPRVKAQASPTPAAIGRSRASTGSAASSASSAPAGAGAGLT